MGLARIESAVVIGVEARLVEVEVHIASGLPGLTLVGLADTAVNESRDRVRAAIANSGLRWPSTRITVGLSPAWLPKRGPGLDLAIALAVLAADGQIPTGAIERTMALGELSLDGRIRPVAGALAAALASARQGRVPARVITGERDARQVALVPQVAVTVARSLRGIVLDLRGDPPEPDEPFDDPVADVPVPQSWTESVADPSRDLSQVKGQREAKRALEVAAAGGHHLALLGRAGVGKTLLAERLADLLPDLSERAALEVTAIHQLAGRVAKEVIARPPCEAPHHTASRVAMVGGGSDNRPTVGVVSLAHRGVLLLDEAAEFEPRVLDALREPVESGRLTVARAGFQVTLPALIQVILATNPCPCGNALESSGRAPCRCTSMQRRRYLGRLSGPLMDRVDVRCVLSRPTLAELRADAAATETTADVAHRVAAARAAAAARTGGSAAANCEVRPEVVELDWPLPAGTRREIDRACGRDSMRGRGRITRLAWTIADLAGREAPGGSDVEEAVRLRAGGDSWAAA